MHSWVEPLLRTCSVGGEKKHLQKFIIQINRNNYTSDTLANTERRFENIIQRGESAKNDSNQSVASST